MTNGPSGHEVQADKDGQGDQVDQVDQVGQVDQVDQVDHVGQVDQVGPDVEGGETGPRAAALPGPVSARPL